MSSALDSFVDKWRARWPEWAFVERFVDPAHRDRAVAWFALLQEFDDILNVSSDPTPSDAKLAWWGEELRSWAGQRSRHPLGRVLEPVRAPWAQLAESLPSLIDARERPADPAQARAQLAGFAEAVAEVEAAVFDVPVKAAAARAVLDQMLAQRVQERGIAAVPASTDEARWQQQLLGGWPGRVAGSRPRRLYSSLARARLQARLKGGEFQPSPAAMLLRSWWAARG